MGDCLICDQLEALDSLPGGPVVDDSAVVAYHLPPIDRFPQQYLGRFLVVTRRHVDHLADLTPDEAAAVGLASRTVATGLQALEDVERVHVAVIGLGVPHFHQHVFPRYAWMPREADWNALHELPGAPRGASAAIADFVDRFRANIGA